MTHRRAVVNLDIRFLEAMLGIEAPMKIVRVLNPTEEEAVRVLIYDPDLPETEEGQQYPQAVLVRTRRKDTTRVELC